MRVKKLSNIAIFVAGIVLVFVLIWTRNFFKTNTAHGATTQNLVVYADQLSGLVSNWSWGSFVNFSNTSPVNSGSNSISFTPGAWGGLYLHANTPVTTTSYTSLQFAMQTSDSPSNFSLLFYDGNNQQVKTVKLSQYPGTSQNGWQVYTIPTSIMPATLGGVALQETSGNAGAATYIDSIQFIAPQAVSSTIPTTSSGSSTIQTAIVYTDSLISGWLNWSWNSTVNYTNSDPVYQGSNAISFTPTAGYGGFYIHSDQGISTSPYLALTFAARANASGQTYSVAVYDANNQQLHAPIALDPYGGQPVSGSWKVYTVPLSDLNASNKTIKGIMIQDTTGKTGQTLFIDQVGLTTDPQPTTPVATTVAPTTAPTVAPVTFTAPVTTSAGNPLSGMPFFNDPDANPALQQEQQWQSSRPTDAAQMAKIANQPKAIWMGSWNSSIQTDVQNIVTKANGQSIPVFVAYNIPGRDCGSYSAGGTGSLQAYEAWIASFAQGIGSHRAAVILEPDALAQITCLSSGDQSQRYQMLSYAVQAFKALGHTSIYIDAGNAAWIGASDMATRLKQAGIDKADGFALNVSNFLTSSASVSYGQQLSGMIGGKHFVVDTSRNGNGPAPDNAWCNPNGRALGVKPTTQTGNALVDAYLWLKYPGESDGSCNGAPAAGVWYPDYALGLAQRASW